MLKKVTNGRTHAQTSRKQYALPTFSKLGTQRSEFHMHAYKNYDLVRLSFIREVNELIKTKHFSNTHGLSFSKTF